MAYMQARTCDWRGSPYAPAGAACGQPIVCVVRSSSWKIIGEYCAEHGRQILERANADEDLMLRTQEKRG